MADYKERRKQNAYVGGALGAAAAGPMGFSLARKGKLKSARAGAALGAGATAAGLVTGAAATRKNIKKNSTLSAFGIEH